MGKKRLEPTKPTAKRLYGLSGNRCAFPGCEVPIINPETGANRGELAHIRGENPSSARHDPNMSDEERRAFENLMLLCATHHTEIDHTTSRDNYSVECLCEMKAEHEASSVPDQLAEALLNCENFSGDLNVVQLLQQAHTIKNTFSLVPPRPSEELGLPSPHCERLSVDWFELQRIVGVIHLASLGAASALESAFAVFPKITQSYLVQLADANLIYTRNGLRWAVTHSASRRFMLRPHWIGFASNYSAEGSEMLSEGGLAPLRFGGWERWFRAIPLAGPGRVIQAPTIWGSQELTLGENFWNDPEIGRSCSPLDD